MTMKKLIVVGLAASAALALTAGGWAGWSGYRDANTVAESVYAYDTTDPELVAPDATAVFTGTVLADTGRRTVEDLPSDTYRVRVEQVLKGAAAGELLITQSADGESVKYTVGQTYVWATNPASRPEDGAAQLYDAPPRPADTAAVTTWARAVG
ncbi:hypothetical protein [Streptomyces sp. NPDC051567]|uniref:hypothetical protein n=1 Tax=Streptomyces sp. NPDC051567 TaxID=3365660 RepID=UPI00379F36EF